MHENSKEEDRSEQAEDPEWQFPHVQETNFRANWEGARIQLVQNIFSNFRWITEVQTTTEWLQKLVGID